MSSTIMSWQHRELSFSPPVDQKDQGSSDRARTWTGFDSSIRMISINLHARDNANVGGYAQVV
jgi:hypothetical protein